MKKKWIRWGLKEDDRFFGVWMTKKSAMVNREFTCSPNTKKVIKVEVREL